MQSPEIPEFEQERLAVLDSLGIVDTPAEEGFDRVTGLVQQFFSVPIALVSLVTPERQWFKSVQGLAVRETPREISFCGHAIAQDLPLVVEDTHTDPRFADNPLVTSNPSIRFYAGCQLRHRKQPIGTLCIIDKQPRAFDAAQLRALRSFADIVEGELRLRELDTEQNRLIEELDASRRQALLDHLTGTWNRRGIEELVPRELSRAARANDAVAIMLIDVDRFKAINDGFGHPAGDSALQEVARRIRRCIRPHDVLGRYGGDEFLVFLGKCGRDDAHIIGSRMLAAVSERPVDTAKGSFNTSLSIGLYSMQEVAGRSMGQIIEAADQALFRAKDLGRNQLAHY